MRDVAVFVHHALIAGAEPAVVERVGVRLGVVLVLASSRSVRGSRSRRSRPRGTVVPVVVDDANLRAAGSGRRCPAFASRGGSGLLAIWCAASVMPYASTTGTPNTRSNSAITVGGSADDDDRMKRSR